MSNNLAKLGVGKNIKNKTALWVKNKQNKQIQFLGYIKLI